MRRSKVPCFRLMTQRPLDPMGSLPFSSRAPGTLLEVRCVMRWQVSSVPSAFNCTIIALVPKVPKPSSLHDYRPITCCNTIYKCISKIIAARIKRYLPNIICPSQTAFMQGRSIVDNILLTQELMKNYHCESRPPRCVLKIDLKKAYDSIRWGCIMDILTAMGTPFLLLRCIKACITTPKFSICVNGELTGFFAGKRGGSTRRPFIPLSVSYCYGSLL